MTAYKHRAYPTSLIVAAAHQSKPIATCLSQNSLPVCAATDESKKMAHRLILAALALTHDAPRESQCAHHAPTLSHCLHQR